MASRGGIEAESHCISACQQFWGRMAVAECGPLQASQSLGKGNNAIPMRWKFWLCTSFCQIFRNPTPVFGTKPDYVCSSIIRLSTTPDWISISRVGRVPTSAAKSTNDMNLPVDALKLPRRQLAASPCVFTDKKSTRRESLVCSA